MSYQRYFDRFLGASLDKSSKPFILINALPKSMVLMSVFIQISNAILFNQHAKKNSHPMMTVLDMSLAFLQLADCL